MRINYFKDTEEKKHFRSDTVWVTLRLDDRRVS